MYSYSACRLARKLRPRAGIRCVDLLHRHAGFAGPRKQEVDGGDRALERGAALVRREPSRVRRGPWWRHALCPTNSRRGGCEGICFHVRFIKRLVLASFRKNSKARSCTLAITRRPGITKGKRWPWSAPALLARRRSIESALDTLSSLTSNDRSRHSKGPS